MREMDDLQAGSFMTVTQYRQLAEQILTLYDDPAQKQALFLSATAGAWNAAPPGKIPC